MLQTLSSNVVVNVSKLFHVLTTLQRRNHDICQDMHTCEWLYLLGSGMGVQRGESCYNKAVCSLTWFRQ